ncbi:MAG: transposase [Mycoplasmataceae bacterium RC_NB112A]|nr:MAG: transposase [Mycoplasmataceae bacterium RC_NB112A]
MSEFTNIPNLLKLIDEKVFIKHLEKIIWKGGELISPFDFISKVYRYANGKYGCKNTGKYFTVKNGTIFENSKLPLWKWFYALHMHSDYRKRVSSWQLAKNIETTQTTAWFILHRLRLASDIPLFKGILKALLKLMRLWLVVKTKPTQR